MFVNDRDVAASLLGCRLSKNRSDSSRCFEGVWMELFWGDSGESDPAIIGWDVTRPLDPCTATQNDAKPACFIYSAFGYLRTHKKDYDGAIQLCMKSNLRANDTDYCLKGVGITMNSHFKGRNLEQAEAFTVGFNQEQKFAFYEGVFGYATLSGISEKELQDTCARFKEDGEMCSRVLDEY